MSNLHSSFDSVGSAARSKPPIVKKPLPDALRGIRAIKTRSLFDKGDPWDGSSFQYTDSKMSLDEAVAERVKDVHEKEAQAKAALDAMRANVGANVGYVMAVPPEPPMPVAPQPPAPAPVMAAAPVKTGSLRTFINSADEIEGSAWTPEVISQALTDELWRTRDVDEVIREGDILCLERDGGPWFDRVQGWKDAPITQEQIDLHNVTVYTLEGAGKRKRPMFDKTTADYRSMYDVPKGRQLKLPNDENEAKRFFQCDVIVTEMFEKARPVKCFYPIPNQMADRRFRRVFSRIFVDFAKKHFREHIKGLIHGRGDGIHLKRGMSVKKILRAVQDLMRDGTGVDSGIVIEKVAAHFNLPAFMVARLVAKSSYGQAANDEAVTSFVQRMGNRKLDPNDFKYDKALGIEIETISPVSREKLSTRVPSYVRVDKDGSLRIDSEGQVKPDEKKTWSAEFRILIKREEMETRILKTVEAIAGTGCYVNKSCGLHVHFDMRTKPEYEVKVLHERLTKWLSVLRELLPPSRRANKYCAFEAPDEPHHAAVSIDAYKRHKTLEVRVHSATLNHIKIIQWVRLIETIIETKFLPLPKTSTIDALKMLTLTEADRTFWLKRHQQLNPELYKGGKIDLGFLGDKANEIE